MPRKKGYVSALENAHTAHEKLRLSQFGDLAVSDPVACEMASDLRSMIAVIQGDKALLRGRKPPTSLFADHPEGTLGREMVKAASGVLNYVAEAVIARNGASLRALADVVEQDPSGATDDGRVRSFLVALFLPAKVGGKPYLRAMTRAQIQELVHERTGIHKDQRVIAKLCKSLGIRVKKDEVGRKNKRAL